MTKSRVKDNLTDQICPESSTNDCMVNIMWKDEINNKSEVKHHCTQFSELVIAVGMGRI